MARQDDPLGWEPCPACKRRVFFAWDAAMTSVALEPDDSGDFAVSTDRNHIPWCRPAAGSQLEFGETMHRLHDPGCPAPLASVSDLASRRRERHHEQPDTTPRRRANA
jgi:hypothetical protein